MVVSRDGKFVVCPCEDDLMVISTETGRTIHKLVGVCGAQFTMHIVPMTTANARPSDADQLITGCQCHYNLRSIKKSKFSCRRNAESALTNLEATRRHNEEGLEGAHLTNARVRLSPRRVCEHQSTRAPHCNKPPTPAVLLSLTTSLSLSLSLSLSAL